MTVLFMAILVTVSEDVEAENYPIHITDNGLSSEDLLDDEENHITEQPERSWEDHSGFRSREWKDIGTWSSNSEELMYNMTFEEPVDFNIWWRETDQGQDDSYDASVQYRFRLLINGDDAAFYSDEDSGETYECARDEPCEWIGSTELNFTDISKGSVFELEIEYWAFSDIEIYYNNFTMDSGITLHCSICYPVPLAVMDIPFTEAENGTLVEFNGSGTTEYGEISDYLWESNIDGVLSDVSQFNTTNLSLGNHIIYFSVTNTLGYNNTTSKSLWIYAVPSALANDIGWNDETPKNKVEPGAAVTFKGGGNDVDGEIVLYEWDFNGDGEVDWSSEEAGSTTFIYNIEGTYTAVLRVTDDDGFTDTDSRVITVIEEEDEETAIPSISLISVVISISLLAIFRRKN